MKTCEICYNQFECYNWLTRNNREKFGHPKFNSNEEARKCNKYHSIK